MKKIVSCGIIIPTKNKAPRLKLTLSALESQQSEISEIIIVDDGSIDQTPSLVLQFSRRLPIQYIHPPKKGRAAARNAGAAKSKSDLLIFLDDDILIGKRFVQAHKKAQYTHQTIVHGPLHELVGAATLHDPAKGGRGIPPLSYDILSKQGFEMNQGRYMINALERSIELMFKGVLKSVAPWLCAVGANMSISRLAWSALGGFDEAFGITWGCEDLEFGYRAHQAGFNFELSKNAYGVHMTHQRADRWEQHQINLNRFIHKHPVPGVICLPKLLGPDGSPEIYESAVLNHIR